jgi:hypothetical protein
MAKPATKAELLEEIESEHQKLEKSLSMLSDEQMVQPGACGQWSVKDILAHLFSWEQMFLGWYETGLRGGVPKTPAPDLNWGQLPILNQRIYEKHRDRSLADVRAEFGSSYQRIGEAIQGMSEEELYTPERYTWLGKAWTLGQFAAASTSSHYRWAGTLIRKWARPQTKHNRGGS